MVMGTGAMPDVMLARAAGLELGETGGVVVDARLQTSAPGIYAAGDVAEYESVVHGGRRIRVEHWDVAFNQGKTAALNMLGQDQPHDVVPYFFSDLSDWSSLEYVGPAHALGPGGGPWFARRRGVQHLLRARWARRGRALGGPVRRPRARSAAAGGGDQGRTPGRRAGRSVHRSRFDLVLLAVGSVRTSNGTGEH